MTREESLKVPALILLAMGIVSGIGAAIVSSVTVQMLPPEAASMGGLIAGIGFVAAIISVFILWWAIPSVLFFLLSRVFSGTGSIKRTFEFVAYGMIPQIASGIISTGIFYVYFTSLRLSPITDPMLIAEEMEAIMQSPMLQMATLISLLFILWSASLWIFGMQEAHRLSRRNAAITVGIPVALYIIYTVVTFWGM
ncbi:MAG: YIP1 family protein [Methanomicrobiales archaeon]|nr:YIP1 family protein [Methanomicrobiales archaeon]